MRFLVRWVSPELLIVECESARIRNWYSRDFFSALKRYRAITELQVSKGDSTAPSFFCLSTQQQHSSLAQTVSLVSSTSLGLVKDLRICASLWPSPMASSRRLARQITTGLLRQRESITCSATHVRAFTSGRVIRPVGYSGRSTRLSGAISQIRHATSQAQVAPNAKAYLESGAIAGGQNLVNVNKVLVIGSGGLSIGQAGEFDYSGR